jgi:excisionase family DNA binding protein
MERYLNLRETMTYLGLADCTIRRLVRRGHLPVVRVGRALRFRERTLDAFMASREAAGPRQRTEAAGAPQGV